GPPGPGSGARARPPRWRAHVNGEVCARARAYVRASGGVSAFFAAGGRWRWWWGSLARAGGLRVHVKASYIPLTAHHPLGHPSSFPPNVSGTLDGYHGERAAPSPSPPSQHCRYGDGGHHHHHRCHHHCHQYQQWTPSWPTALHVQRDPRSPGCSGHPAGLAPAAEHGRPVPPADVCRSAAAPYAPDSGPPAAAPGQQPAPEPGSCPTGKPGCEQAKQFLHQYWPHANATPNAHDQPGHFSSGRPAHQPGPERELCCRHRLRHRPAGGLAGQRQQPHPDGQPGPDVPACSDAHLHPHSRSHGGAARGHHHHGHGHPAVHHYGSDTKLRPPPPADGEPGSGLVFFGSAAPDLGHEAHPKRQPPSRLFLLRSRSFSGQGGRADLRHQGGHGRAFPGPAEEGRRGWQQQPRGRGWFGPPGGAGNRTVTPVTTHPLIAPAYSQLQSHQMASQPPPPKPAQHQFVIQQQQQIQPRLPSQLQANACANFGNSAGPQAQGHLPSQVTPVHLPSCQASNQHKAGANQPPQHLAHPSGAPAQGPLRPESGSPSRAAGCPNHGTQRRFQHASAVILQVQPSAGMPSVNTVENSRKDPGLGEKTPADSRPAPPHLPPPTSSMSPSAPPEPQAQECTGSQPHEAVRDSVRPPLDTSSPGMTSGNGTAAPSTVAGAAPHNGENKPPQALVKPQILTHVIEGFVIQEGAEPFPVGRSSLLVGSLKKKYAQSLLAEKSLQQQQQQQQQDNTTTTDSEMEDPYLQESKEEGSPPKLKCELCGRLDFAYKFKRSKRFCSMACAKRYNVGCTKRVGLFHPDRSKLQKANTPQHSRRRTCKATLPPLSKESKKVAPVSLPPSSGPLPITGSLQLAHGQEESSRCSDNSSYEEPLSPLSASSSASRRHPGERDMELPDVHVRDLVALGHHFLPSEPTKWNVEDVYEFIRSLPADQSTAVQGGGIPLPPHRLSGHSPEEAGDGR
ncbi:hypothetical protein JRQ81_009933, partial [Phrynocephalus forsythii]